MYIEFPCVGCGKSLKISEEHLGRKVRCPYCHHGQVAQAPESKGEDPLQFLQFLETPATESPSSGATATAPPPKPAPAPSSPTDESLSGTDVSAVWSGLIGLGIFVAIYVLLFPFRSWYPGALLWNRGWVQFAEVFLASWSGVILVMKSRKLAAQRDSMLFDLLPEKISPGITPDTVDAFLAHIRSLPVRIGQSFLVNRVVRGLEHFGVLRNSGEVAGRMATQSEIDNNAVSASYSLVKVFVWAIPILGFIGTVQGIGQAVGAFSATMNAASDIGALKDSFGTVTSGLGTAFDTTLLALVLSMFIMFPMSSLQKSEQGLLNAVDEYCNENFLKRLKDFGAASMPESIDGAALQAAIDAALAPHHAELRAWNRKLESLGDALGRHIVQGWGKVDEQMRSHHEKTLREMAKALESYQQLTERLRTTSDQQAKAMADLVAQTKDAQQRVGAAMHDASQAIQTAGDSVGRYFSALEQGVHTLNVVLASLSEKQIVVQAPLTLSPRRRGRLLGMFARRDGQ